MNPVRNMIIGGSLLVFGWLILFLNVMKVIPLHFWLLFVAYGCTVIGMALGITSAIMYIRKSRKDLD